MLFFRVWFILSMALGRYRAVPLSPRKAANSAEMNCGPLSVVIVVGVQEICYHRANGGDLWPLQMKIVDHHYKSLVVWDSMELPADVQLEVCLRLVWPVQWLPRWPSWALTRMPVGDWARRFGVHEHNSSSLRR